MSLLRSRSLLSFLSTAATAASLAGCGPSPDEACTHYLELRRKADLPNDAEVMKECVSDLQTAKKKLPESGATVVGCVAVANDVDEADACPTRATRGKEREEAEERFPEGLAAEATRAWAKGEGTVLSDEACAEGARSISRTKARLGIIRDGEREAHEKELRKACKAEMSNAAYARTFSCLRKADEQDEILRCTTAEGDAAKASVIEGCYKKCKAEHGGAGDPAYKTCFTSCRSAGGF